LCENKATPELISKQVGGAAAEFGEGNEPREGRRLGYSVHVTATPDEMCLYLLAAALTTCCPPLHVPPSPSYFHNPQAGSPPLTIESVIAL
jgi:hypothetical protein